MSFASLRTRLLRAFAITALLFAPAVARAQPPGEDLRVYLVTFGPGDAVWERFGHNAIWLQDTRSGYGVAYNWGMFSFDQPGFIPRLMKGRMLYWMAGYDATAFVNEYVKMNRSVWAQELNLTPVQRDSLRQFLEWNAQEEHKHYLYEPFRDNCSTRVRDAIDRVTGGALAASLKPIETDQTLRTHTQTLTYKDPALYVGLMLALGQPVDEPLSAWGEGFIPMELREWAGRATVRAPDGSTQPLVIAEQTIYEAVNRAPLPESAPNMILPFTLLGILLGGLLLLLARIVRLRGRFALLLAVLIGVLELKLGFFGSLLAMLWGLTDHTSTYQNENVLQANPLSLVLAVLAPAAILGKVWARRWAAWFGLFVFGLSMLGLVLQIFPGLDQANGEIIGLMLPVHAAIAWILWQRWFITPAGLTRHEARP